MGEGDKGDIVIRTSDDTKLVDDKLVFQGAINVNVGQIFVGRDVRQEVRITTSNPRYEMTLSDLARVTGLSQSTLGRDARTGKLKARMVGRRWMTSEKNLRSYMEVRQMVIRWDEVGEIG